MKVIREEYERLDFENFVEVMKPVFNFKAS